jgi:hypothetical protein
LLGVLDDWTASCQPSESGKGSGSCKIGHPQRLPSVILEAELKFDRDSQGLDHLKTIWPRLLELDFNNLAISQRSSMCKEAQGSENP